MPETSRVQSLEDRIAVLETLVSTLLRAMLASDGSSTRHLATQLEESFQQFQREDASDRLVSVERLHHTRTTELASQFLRRLAEEDAAGP